MCKKNAAFLPYYVGALSISTTGKLTIFFLAYGLKLYLSLVLTAVHVYRLAKHC
jgi:hypothetical protein